MDGDTKKIKFLYNLSAWQEQKKIFILHASFKSSWNVNWCFKKNSREFEARLLQVIHKMISKVFSIRASHLSCIWICKIANEFSWKTLKKPSYLPSNSASIFVKRKFCGASSFLILEIQLKLFCYFEFLWIHLSSIPEQFFN